MYSDSLQKVREILLETHSITKPELAQMTGLTVATCGYILNSLVKSGEVVTENFRSSNGGRPAMLYRYCGEKTTFLCLYAQSQNSAAIIRYRVTDALGAIHGKGSFNEKFINERVLTSRIQKIVKQHPNICTVTIGIQGGVSQGVVEFSDFPDLDGIDLSSAITKKISIPTYIENDMNTIALGYSKKNFEEKDIAILFTPKNNPPAGGFLVEGNILRGSTNLAGELSYFPFPFSREHQHEFFANLSSALPHILQILFATIVFLDPAVVVFTGDFAEELSQRNLDIQMRNHLKRPHLPRLCFIPNPVEEYFSGLAKIAADHFLKNTSSNKENSVK